MRSEIKGSIIIHNKNAKRNVKYTIYCAILLSVAACSFLFEYNSFPFVAFQIYPISFFIFLVVRWIWFAFEGSGDKK